MTSKLTNLTEIIRQYDTQKAIVAAGLKTLAEEDEEAHLLFIRHGIGRYSPLSPGEVDKVLDGEGDPEDRARKLMRDTHCV